MPPPRIRVSVYLSLSLYVCAPVCSHLQGRGPPSFKPWHETTQFVSSPVLKKGGPRQASKQPPAYDISGPSSVSRRERSKPDNSSSR